MNQIIRLTEDDIRNIVNETLLDYYYTNVNGSNRTYESINEEVDELAQLLVPAARMAMRPLAKHAGKKLSRRAGKAFTKGVGKFCGKNTSYANKRQLAKVRRSMMDAANNAIEDGIMGFGDNFINNVTGNNQNDDNQNYYDYNPNNNTNNQNWNNNNNRGNSQNKNKKR